MQKVTNEEKLEVLIAVLAIFKKRNNDCYDGICLAITYYESDASQRSVRQKNAALWLRVYIRKVLGDHAYLNSWLGAKRPKVLRTTKRMQFYREAWLGWLIGQVKENIAIEYKGKGTQ